MKDNNYTNSPIHKVKFNDFTSITSDVVVYYSNQYELEPVIAISIGEANKILNKSFYALSAAKMSENKVYYYK